MKQAIKIFFILFFISLLIGCNPTMSTNEFLDDTKTIPTISLKPSQVPSQSNTPTPSKIYVTTSTFNPHLDQTVALALPPTLESDQAEEVIRTLLQESVDCEAPCFWGIVPGQTTLAEARNIFAQLGFPLEYTYASGGKEFYGVIIDFDNGLKITPVLTIQTYAVRDDDVKNITIGITPEEGQAGIQREWLAYSPEVLVNRYGTPSKVDFFMGRAAPTPRHSMVIYFDSVNLIVEYSGTDIIRPNNSFQVCPLTFQVDYIRIWLGKQPENPPDEGVSLEDATSITVDEFSRLMTKYPENGCFNLNGELFPK